MKKFNFRKIGAKASAFAMAAALSMSFATPVHAADATVTAPGTSDCEVSTTVASGYTIKIPLSITLTEKETSYEGTSSFSVTGLLPGDKLLKLSYPQAVKTWDNTGYTMLVRIDGGSDPDSIYSYEFYSGDDGDYHGTRLTCDNIVSCDFTASVNKDDIPAAGTFTGDLMFCIEMEDR